MALSAKGKGGPRGEKDVPEAGTHFARVVGLTDLGHQPGYEYKGEDIASAYKIELTYELVNSLMADGRPHWVSEEVNVNDFEGDGITSKMMARVRVIDRENDSNDGKDLTKLVGKPCMVSIVMNDNGYPKIKGQSAVSGVPSGVEVPALQNPTQIFDMDEPDMDLWEKFPEFKQGKIKAALNFNETAIAKSLAEDGEY